MADDHHGLPVAGYQPQSAEKVALVNANKILEERVLRALDGIAAYPGMSHYWIEVARRHIEMGFMAANRAVFQPGRIRLPEDLSLPDALVPRRTAAPGSSDFSPSEPGGLPPGRYHP